MEILTHTLPNGIRLVHRQVNSMVAHFGFMVHTGSRDELQDEHGMAHFIEHVIFKGTQKRKAWHILSRLEDVGGDINAFTSKEETCVYASFLKQDYERAVELIYDILFHSIFPKKELEREKGIILDEILSYEDNPSELIFDEFEEQVFNFHPIGRSILGTEKIITGFDKTQVENFIRNNYATSEMVLCSVGNLSFEKYIRLCEKYFGEVKSKDRLRERTAPNSYTPLSKKLNKNTHQVHSIVGNIAYHSLSEKRIPLALLNNILGGPGMNSRLNMSLREKSGYSYSVESHYTAYSDTGIFLVYYGCEKDKSDKSLHLVYKEFDKMKNCRMGSLQFSKAKKQLLGQLAISGENNEHFMLTMGKNILVYDRVDSLEEIAKKIEAVTTSDILDSANEILDQNNLSVLQYN